MIYICPTSQEHGVMVLRPLERQTPEQRWCGTWYDCQQCHASTLIKSEELITQLEEQFQRIKTAWLKQGKRDRTRDLENYPTWIAKRLMSCTD